MQDRFKFRAWDKKHGIMVYCEEEASRDQIHEYEALYDWDEDYGCWEYKCLSGLESLIRDDNFVLEQCTGLKDKNGKLIYENDLIKCPSGIYRIAVDDFGLWTAIYNNNPFKDVAEWSDIVKEYAFNQNDVELEVLGNIHENADLLEKQDD
jgi:uncharacterized phage protein (TIGR01671 family)